MDILKAKNISKNFGENQVLKDISFDVKKAEVVSIIGPSGSGKSTLLRCATMLETVSSGEIYYKGEALVKTENGKAVYAQGETLQKIKCYYGLVFQNFNLFPHLSVMENITLSPTLVLKKDKEEVNSQAVDLIKKMGLTGKENSYPGELSGGQKQRVAIARALAMQPEILFFDEPTSALDPELTGEILRIIKQLAQKKMTMVIVTHEMSFAHDVSDTVIFMDGGFIVEKGSPDDVITNPKSDRTKAFLNKFNS